MLVFNLYYLCHILTFILSFFFFFFFGIEFTQTHVKCQCLIQEIVLYYHSIEGLFLKKIVSFFS